MRSVATAKHLIGNQFISKNGQSTDYESTFSRMNLIAVYFAGDWHPDCREFTPKLKSAYKTWKEDGESIEVVLIPADLKQDGFNKHLNEIDWLSVPFGAERIRNSRRMFGIYCDADQLPKVIVVNQQGTVSDANAVKSISEKGANVINEWKKRSAENW